MDYFQGVVAEYLRANRSTFVNPEFHFALGEDLERAAPGTSWFVDVLAVNFAERHVYLCEVTYSKTLSGLIQRLGQWSANWTAVQYAIKRDACVPEDWAVRPWLFIPQAQVGLLVRKLPPYPEQPLISALEQVLPWKYRTWNRQTPEFAELGG